MRPIPKLRALTTRRRPRRPSRSVRARHGRRDDSGQILIAVIAFCAIVSAIVPVMVEGVTSNTPLVATASNEHAALAAAEAGIQWYRNQLDSQQNYFSDTAANDSSDPALTGWCSSQCDLGGTSPQESFHYVPNNSYLNQSSGNPYPNQILATVTGRAGSNGKYTYDTIQAGFSRSTILNYAYYTSIETTDPIDPFYDSSILSMQYVIVCAPGSYTGTWPNAACKAGTGTQEPMYSTTVSSVENSAGTSSTSYANESIWSLVCQLDDWQPNTFIDNLGGIDNSINGGAVATSAAPYWGPYYGSTNFAFLAKVGGASTQSMVEVPAGGCYEPHTFSTGEQSSGPFYSQDQIYVSGSPAFNGGSTSTPSLQTAAQPSVCSSWAVPGWIQVTSNNKYPNGPYTCSGYAPVGVTVLPGNTNTATFKYGPLYADTSGSTAKSTEPKLGVNETHPTFNSDLLSYASGAVSGGGTGCVFTGPTTIQLYNTSSGDSPGSERMNVWSPLSGSTSCGTYSTTSPYNSGLSLPSNGVIYVQNCAATNPNCSGPNGLTSTNSTGAPCSATGTTSFSAVPTLTSDGCGPCFNPLVQDNVSGSTSTSSFNAAQCYEGDVFVGGEVAGGLTIGAAANIDITRPITYACADSALSSGLPNAANPASITACGTSTDVLGLDAAENVLLSNPFANDPSNPLSSTTDDCAWTGMDNGNAAPGTDPNPGDVNSIGSTAAKQISNIWPNCALGAYYTDSTSGSSYGDVGTVVDAAVLALNGALTTQNWNLGLNVKPAWAVYLNGTDISEYRGLFGNGGSNGGNMGYNKSFSYDSRLNYLIPPDLLSSSVAIWNDVGDVVCGTSPVSGTSTTASCPALK